MKESPVIKNVLEPAFVIGQMVYLLTRDNSNSVDFSAYYTEITGLKLEKQGYTYITKERNVPPDIDNSVILFPTKEGLINYVTDALEEKKQDEIYLLLTHLNLDILILLF